ncbi:hypothetical protein MED121_12660 [Marinomonas sp. MED121]|nr:hypothetical protein MED121_12660 [Marinomonas sp. MED121]
MLKKKREEFFKYNNNNNETLFDGDLINKKINVNPIFPGESEYKHDSLAESFDSNEVEYDTNSVNGDDEPIQEKDRNYINDVFDENKHKKKHQLLLAAVSTEAGGKFYKGYQKASSEHEIPFKGYNLSSTDIQTLDNKQFVSTATDFKTFMRDLFKCKRIPHAIVVIEGEHDCKQFSIDRAGNEFKFIKKETIYGLRKNGSKDAKQNFTLFVRKEYNKKFRLKEENPDEINRSAALHYEFCGKKYKTHFVHITNDNAKSPNKVISKFNEKRELETELSTHIFGDTNFKNVFSNFGELSAGGNRGKDYLVFSSSGAKMHNHFIQAIQQTDKFVLVSQPSMLNDVYYNYSAKDKNLESNSNTDHPSGIQSLFLPDVVKVENFNDL